MKRVGLHFAVIGLILGAGFYSARAQSGKVKVSQITRPESELSLIQTGGGGFLGVFLGDVNDERAKELKLAEARGALVGKVLDESPAAKAGLRENDVILSYNGERVGSAAQMHRLLSETPPGRSVTLGVSRGGVMQNIPVTLGERRGNLAFGFPNGAQAEAEAIREMADKLRLQSEEMRRKLDEDGAREALRQSEELRKQAEEMRAEAERMRREGRFQGFDSGRRFFYGPSASRFRLGASVTPLSEQLAKFFNVKGSGGLLVTEVKPQSPAERAGLKAGDCITAVGGERVNSASELARLLARPGKDEKEASEATLTIVRDRSEQTIKVKLE